MRANKSKGRSKSTLRDVLTRKRVENVTIFNSELMLKVVPQIIARDLYSKLQTNVEYISTQNKYYINIAINNLGNNKKDIEILEQVGKDELESIVMGVYRLIGFISYKVLDNDKDALKKIILAILVDNDALISGCNNFVKSDDEVIKLYDVDSEGKMIKTNQQLYIELMTLFALFVPNQKNVFKTSGYEVSKWAYFLSGFNIPFIYSIAGVMDTYLVKSISTMELEILFWIRIQKN